MAGEVEAAQAGMAMAKELMPMVKDIFGMFRELMGSVQQTPQPAAPLTTAPPQGGSGVPVATNISIPGMGAISTSLDGVASALQRIAAALEKK